MNIIGKKSYADKPQLRYSRRLYNKMLPDPVYNANKTCRKIRNRGPAVWVLAAALTFIGGVTYWQTAGKKEAQQKQMEYQAKEIIKFLNTIQEEIEQGQNQEPDSTTFVPKTLTWG